MKKRYLSLLVFSLCCVAWTGIAQTTFSNPGGPYNYTVPLGVTLLSLDMAGAQGGNGWSAYGIGGKGGRIQCNLAVTGGQVLKIYVGGQGSDAPSYPPGNAGGVNGGGSSTAYGGAGGGASDVRTGTLLSSRIAVAGGGGGGGYDCGSEAGGGGGGTNGGNGLDCGSYNSGNCGGGGTQSTGGSGITWDYAQNGSLGFGGNGAQGGYTYTWGWSGYYYSTYNYYYFNGGGGGGGYYGGGGADYAGGGGGSSYPTTGATTSFCSSVVSTPSFQNGSGYVTITPPTITVAPTSLAFGNVTTGTTSVPPMYFVMGGLVLSTGGTLTITPPSNFSVSLDGATWFSGPMPYTYAGNSFSNVNVYVRFSPSASISYSGNITITGGGASATSVAVSGTGTVACSGTPSAGTASVSPTTGNAASLFTLNLSGVSAVGGLTYQWQSSPDNSTWTNIQGAIMVPYTVIGISAATYFRCVVTCPSGASASSASVQATFNGTAGSSCTPTFGTTCPTYQMYTSIGNLVGAIGSLSDPATSCAGNYLDQSALPTATLNSGSSYTATLNVSSSYSYQFAVQVWIDFNNDGTFQTTESVGGLHYPLPSNTPTCTINIPANAAAGPHRMRIMGNYYQGGCCGASDYPNLNPCPTGAISYGQVRDYKITIQTLCSGAPNPGITAANPISSCVTFTPNIFNVGENIATGMVYQWQSSTTSPTSGFTNIAGATGRGYVPTISSVGTIYYRDSVRCTSSGQSAVSPSTAATFLAPPSAITGPNNVCATQNITLTDATSGGTWSSSNPANATVGSSTGIVTGITSGTVVTITYTAPSGCITTTPITVNLQPAAITGTMVVCPGATTTLSDATSGGTWSSSNIALATVGSTGIVTGVSGGNPVISYTAPTGCVATAVITVNTLAPITGTPSMCVGLTTTLSDVTPGGNWSSSAPAVAPVGSSSGIVTGVSVGTATISYTVPSIGCTVTQTVAVTNTPVVYSVTGGGTLCSGGPGVSVGLANSNAGVSYQLYIGSSPTGLPVIGSGLALTFGPQTVAGTYYVVGAPGTPCAVTMSGSATVNVNPLPTPFTVTGGGSYCAGGTGVHVGLSSSSIGVNYQLFNGLTPVGSPVPGTSASLDFGLQTATGTYSVGATNTITGCQGNMANTVTISNTIPPTIFTISSGGGYCTGGTGVAITLGGSQTGTSYQLYFGGTPISGAVLAGTGSVLNFGLQTTPGTYTIVATNTTTGCTSTMSGVATITVNSLPTIFNVTGGGAYCSGGSGVHIGLNGSTAGVNYQLYQGTTAVGSPASGTGASLDFGTFTTAGSYTVVATNATTGCQANMSGSAEVTINPLPSAFTVTGGGGYCVGGTGMHIGLSGSAVGYNYQLYNGLTLVGAQAGSGSPLDFGLFTAAGGYIVTATNTTTGCQSTMTGSVNIVINPLPTAFNVMGGGAYCAGGSGRVVGLSGSTSGVAYQLYNGTTPVGAPVNGTGGVISFGLQTTAGAYTVVATNTSTLCTNNMTGSVAISINPTPVVYTVTGGGPYCTGGTGVHIGLSASNTGISYQLYNGIPAIGGPVGGSGTALDFGLQTATGTYTVVATNTTTLCTSNMAGSAIVSTNPLPATFIVSGGGSYCAGTGGADVNMSGSVVGTSYQLYNGTTAVGSPAPGSGALIDFGMQTAAGTYTVVATNTVTGCTRTMTGSAVISIIPLPTIYPVTGGGSYCSGGTGVHIGLGGSNTGVKYQLYNGLLPVGSPLTGTGSSLDFGLKTVVGTYTVIATDTVTHCTNTMLGSVTVSTNPLPALHTITGGGNYCSGGTGVHVGLDGSDIGMNYQIFVGLTPVGIPMSGTGAALDFGLQTVGGTYTIVATNTTTTCTRTMTGTIAVTVKPLPTAYTVTGGGSYCPAGTGVHIGLSNSDTGVSYRLYRGLTPVGSSVSGTGFALDFGLQTALGTYTVVATNGTTTCTNNMAGSVTVSLYALPSVYNVGGGGSYCPLGAGVHVGLVGSSTGVTYQLYRDMVAVGSPLTGTGLPLDYGLQTTPGTYTVVATTTSTTCTNNMSGSAIVALSPVPASHTVTGGGGYCTGGVGTHVGLDGSDPGTDYQLYRGVTPVGTPMGGTGLALDFGLQTTSGTYTVVATNTTTTCTNTMVGSAVVGISSLPITYNVTGGGNYCAGGTGVHVMLSGSETGTNYQLFNGMSIVGSPVAGTGSSLDFGLQTGAGTYTVVATNTTTSCTNNMTGGVAIGIDPLPATFGVTGGGNYCAGGTGVHVNLLGSVVGTSYQLYNGLTPMGSPVAGTGFGLDFGPQTSAGTYTITATTISTGCMSTMTGSVTVDINALPTPYTVTGLGSSYCAGGTGIDITLSGSDMGISYQLYNGTTAVGSPVAGSGLPIDFGFLTAAGTYTVKAVNTVTSCTNDMAGSAAITVNPPPVAFTVTGGGHYCSGGNGVAVGLSGSNFGVNYQLYKDLVAVGATVPGTGVALSFGLQTAVGNYTVVATNPGTTCTNNMSGSTNVAVYALPAAFTVTGGGSYCAGGTGSHVGLSGSAFGVSYQLRRGTTNIGSPVAGTGSALDFGAQTVAGTYTVVATNTSTTCTNNMSGSATININALPATYSVTGGGNYCPGGIGVHVGLAGSSTGVSYQLYAGTSTVGSPVPGTGAGIDFGLQTTAGTYTIVAMDATTGCTNTMSGGVNVVVNPLPTVQTVVGGGSYCAGGSGVHVGLNGSQAGISYQLYNGFTPSGAPVIGSGSAIDLGLRTAAGTYTVIGTDNSTACGNNMSGSVAITVSPLVTPSVSISTGSGDTLCAGHATTFSALAVNGGTVPTYQWTVNGITTGTGSTYNYMPLSGDVVGVTLTSNATCATPATASSSMSVIVNTDQLPAVAIAANPGSVVCQGTAVNFTASPSFGGSAPSYSWIVNGTSMSTSPSFSYTPADGDDVYVVMASNYRCRLANNATSSHVNMEVDIAVVPMVSITANPTGNVAAGQPVTLTATVTNAGPTPSYQWYVNGVAVPGATLPTYTSSNFANLDSVTCQVQSSGTCVGLAGSSTTVIHVMNVGVQQIITAGNDIKLIPNPNQGIFTVKGSLGTNSDDEVTLEVTDMLGQVIYTNKIIAHNGEVNQKIELSKTIANGMYILNLRSGAENKVFHLVVEK